MPGASEILKVFEILYALDRFECSCKAIFFTDDFAGRIHLKYRCYFIGIKLAVSFIAATFTMPVTLCNPFSERNVGKISIIDFNRLHGFNVADSHEIIPGLAVVKGYVVSIFSLNLICKLVNISYARRSPKKAYFITFLVFYVRTSDCYVHLII